jgi:hypothetical protein
MGPKWLGVFERRMIISNDRHLYRVSVKSRKIENLKCVMNQAEFSQADTCKLRMIRGGNLNRYRRVVNMLSRLECAVLIKLFHRITLVNFA